MPTSGIAFFSVTYTAVILISHMGLRTMHALFGAVVSGWVLFRVASGASASITLSADAPEDASSDVLAVAAVACASGLVASTLVVSGYRSSCAAADRHLAEKLELAAYLDGSFYSTTKAQLRRRRRQRRKRMQHLAKGSDETSSDSGGGGGHDARVVIRSAVVAGPGPPAPPACLVGTGNVRKRMGGRDNMMPGRHTAAPVDMGARLMDHVEILLDGAYAGDLDHTLGVGGLGQDQATVAPLPLPLSLPPPPLPSPPVLATRARHAEPAWEPSSPDTFTNLTRAQEVYLAAVHQRTPDRPAYLFELLVAIIAWGVLSPGDPSSHAVGLAVAIHTVMGTLHESEDEWLLRFALLAVPLAVTVADAAAATLISPHDGFFHVLILPLVAVVAAVAIKRTTFPRSRAGPRPPTLV